MATDAVQKFIEGFAAPHFGAVLQKGLSKSLTFVFFAPFRVFVLLSAGVCCGFSAEKKSDNLIHLSSSRFSPYASFFRYATRVEASRRVELKEKRVPSSSIFASC